MTGKVQGTRDQGPGMTRREALAMAGAAILGGCARPGAGGEELRLWRALWAADWRQGFAVRFVDRSGEERLLSWHRYDGGGGLYGFLATDEDPPDGDYWPAFCESVHGGGWLEQSWLEAVELLWWRNFRVDWTPGRLPSSMAGGRR